MAASVLVAEDDEGHCLLCLSTDHAATGQQGTEHSVWSGMVRSEPGTCVRHHLGRGGPQMCCWNKQRASDQPDLLADPF